GRGPDPAADQDQQVLRAAVAAHRQEVARAVRDPHSQAAPRHPRADATDARRVDEAGPVCRRRRRDQDLRAVMKIEVKNISGKAVGSIDLDDAVFGAEIHEHLLYEVVKWQLAKRRAGTASTKRLGEVRGSSKKVWKQKGTGQARQGSRQAPHWV